MSEDIFTRMKVLEYLDWMVRRGTLAEIELQRARFHYWPTRKSATAERAG